MQRINSSFISCFRVSVVISSLTYILFKTILIVSSEETLINNDANKTILYPSGTFCFWMYLTNYLVLLIVNSDLFNGTNNLAKCFAVSYVTVLISDTIGINVKLSTLLVQSLCTFEIP